MGPVTDEQRTQRVGEVVTDLSGERVRLEELRKRAKGQANALREVATRLEDRANNKQEPAPAGSDLDCPAAEDVAGAYSGMANARMRIRSLRDQLGDLGIVVD